MSKHSSSVSFCNCGTATKAKPAFQRFSLIENQLQQRLQRLEADLKAKTLKTAEIQEKLIRELKRNDDFQKRLKEEIIRGDFLENQLKAARNTIASVCDKSIVESHSRQSEGTQEKEQGLIQKREEISESRQSRQGDKPSVIQSMYSAPYI